jgi:hypothetical protein
MAQLNNQSPEFLKIIHEAVIQAIKSEVSRRFDESKKKLMDDMDRQKDEIVASIVLNLIKHVEFTTMGNILTIQVMTDTLKV